MMSVQHDPSALVVMGYVSGVFGVKGWIKLNPETEYADSLFDYSEWWLGREGQWQRYRFCEGKVQPKAVIARLEGVSDRDAAFALRGALIAVPRAQLPEPEPDAYYWHDLIGLNVVNCEGIALGAVVRLLETGAHDVLVVQRTQDGALTVVEQLIPFVDVYVLDVRQADGVIVVDWQPDY